MHIKRDNIILACGLFLVSGLVLVYNYYALQGDGNYRQGLNEKTEGTLFSTYVEAALQAEQVTEVGLFTDDAEENDRTGEEENTDVIGTEILPPILTRPNA